MKRLICFLLALLVEVSVIAGPFAATANPAQYVGQFAYASLPACSSTLSGYQAMATDIGPAAGISVVCDGTQWRPNGAQVALHSAVPIGIAPTGSMGNNGAVTLGTALDATYSGGLYLYYPASAIVSGSTAGYYWTVMSSTTVGTVYNNTYTPGTLPAIPPSPTAFATTGPGAFTGVTTAQDTFTFSVPGNLLGKNGGLRVGYVEAHTNSAGNKTITTKYGGTSFHSIVSTTTAEVTQQIRISNRGSAAIQTQATGNTGTVFGATTSVQVTGTVDTTQAQTFALNIQHSTATDWAAIQDVLVEVLP